MSQTRDEHATEPQGDGIARSLRRLRAAARFQLCVQRAGVIVAALLGAALAVGLLDYLLRLPGPLRGGLWLIGAGALGVAIARRLIPAARFQPPLTEIALRLERTPSGRDAGLAGLLASGLELGARRAQGESGELADQAASLAATRYAALRRPLAALSPAGLRRSLLLLGAVGAPIVALSVTSPAYVRTGSARVFAPWSHAVWPKRTGVVSATGLAAHPLGAALPLRAIVTRAPGERSNADVSVRYRVIVGDVAGPSRRALLTPQYRQSTFTPPAGAEPVSGELFERLLDTATLAPPTPTGERVPDVILEYSFETLDDASPDERIVLVDPPALRAASVNVVPPAYLTPALASSAQVVSGPRDLGDASDGRNLVGPVLRGSRVELDLTLSKPVPTPAPGEDPSIFLAAVLPGAESLPDLTATFDGARWTIAFAADRSARLPVQLIDAHGVTSVRDAAIRLEVLDDRPPTASVLEPPADEAVLPTAVVPLAGEGRDDVALAWASLTTQVARLPVDSPRGQPAASGPPEERARVVPTGDDPESLRRAKALGELDVSTLGVKPGEEVWLLAHAQDLLGAQAPREPTRSPLRRLRIIAPAELVEQVRAELSVVREAAKRLAQDQESLALRRPPAEQDPAAAGDQARAQESLSERLGPLSQALERLGARAERNRLDDEAVTGLLRDADELVDEARARSDDARAALDRLSAPSQNAPERAGDAREAAGAQRDTQERLEALADLLDRGQDAWGVQRALSKMIAEQRALRSRTAALESRTQGKTPETMSPEEREASQQLAREQRELSQRAGSLADAMAQRAGEMREADPSRARAMQEAAQRARREQLSDRQAEASRQIQKNQTGQAQSLQQQAQQTLEAMAEDMEKGEQASDESLRRVLADLAQSIEQLIAAQEHELTRLAAPAPGLDAGMIALHQNTLGVAEGAGKDVRGAQRLLELLGAAGESQAQAIVALRGEPLDAPGADAHERTSLGKLREALEEARRLEREAESRDQQRARAALKKAYSEALELHLAIQGETQPLIGKELTRRDKMAARGLGEREREVHARLAELRSTTQDLDQARLFSFAHQRLDESLARAADELIAQRTGPGVQRDQAAAARVLASLVRALSEEKKPDDFKDEQGGGGAGQGGGQQKPPLIPPIAELKLLREMQAEAMDATRAAAEAGLPESDVAAAAALQRSLADLARELLRAIQEQQGEPIPEGEAPAPMNDEEERP
jgi:hypothetical protein